MFETPERRVTKRLYTDFLTGVPDWLMGIGTVNINHDASVGQATLTVDNGVGGVGYTADGGTSQQALQTSNFDEIRLGCSISHNLTGANKFNVTLTDATGTSVSNAWVIAGEKSDGYDNFLLLAEGKSQTKRSLHHNWVSAGGTVRCELRIRPDENHVSFALGDADQLIYEEYSAPYGVADFYPTLKAATDNKGTTESVFLEEFWIETALY